MRNAVLLILLLAAAGAASTLGAQTTAAPMITLAGGAYTMPQSTTITDATSGATILWCYTASGTCTPATAYSGSIYINPATAETLCANATAASVQSANTCATYTAGSGTAAAAPTFSIAPGTYGGPQTVTLTSGTAGAVIYYTLDGSTPDYTSTLYTGPLRIAASTKVNAIAGVIGSRALNDDNSTTNWKNVETCANDNPGGCTGSANANPPPDYDCCTPTSASSPGGVVLTGAACMPGGDGICMEFNQMPVANHQTNALWPRTGATCDHCTWFVSRSNVYYGANSAKVSAFEHDQQDFDKTDDYNLQFGMQCKTCTASANWQIGGTTNTPWISTGITQQFAANAWHSIVKEDHWNLAELVTKPCSSGGKAFPCEYYTRLILDGHVYNMQAAGMCPTRPSGSAGTGCTITADTLETGFGSNVSDQYQIDGSPTSAPVSLNTIIDAASFTAYYDPSPVSTAAYVINPVTATVAVTVTAAAPALLSAYLSTPGNADTLTVPGTLQFAANCHYASGHDQDCTVADIYGDRVTGWSSTVPAAATVSVAGLVTAVAAGSPAISATVNGSLLTPEFGLTVSGASVSLTNVSVATAGGVTGLTIGASNQLRAVCTYSDGSMTTCNTADAHGNFVSSWVSSNPAVATVNSSGLVAAVASGTSALSAVAGGVSSAAMPLAVSVLPPGNYTITIKGPVTITGTVSF